jgi:hypothetical protein
MGNQGTHIQWDFRCEYLELVLQREATRLLYGGLGARLTPVIPLMVKSAQHRPLRGRSGPEVNRTRPGVMRTCLRSEAPNADDDVMVRRSYILQPQPLDYNKDKYKGVMDAFVFSWLSNLFDEMENSKTE